MFFDVLLLLSILVYFGVKKIKRQRLHIKDNFYTGNILSFSQQWDYLCIRTLNADCCFKNVLKNTHFSIYCNENKWNHRELMFQFMPVILSMYEILLSRCTDHGTACVQRANDRDTCVGIWTRLMASVVEVSREESSFERASRARAFADSDDPRVVRFEDKSL